MATIPMCNLCRQHATFRLARRSAQVGIPRLAHSDLLPPEARRLKFAEIAGDPMNSQSLFQKTSLEEQSYCYLKITRRVHGSGPVAKGRAIDIRDKWTPGGKKWPAVPSNGKIPGEFQPGTLTEAQRLRQGNILI